MDADRLAKIQKLMDVANDRATPEAARESYLSKAYELMTQWQITDAMLAATAQGKIENIVKRVVKLTTPTTYSLEYASLIAEVAISMGARGFVSKTYHHNGKIVRAGVYNAIIVGFESDLETIELLAHSLSVQCEMAVAVAAKDDPRGYLKTASQKYNFKRSFLTGFKNRVGHRIRAMRVKTVSESATGTDLVLVDRSAKVDEWVTKNMELGKAIERRYGFDGHAAGDAAGQRANIGQSELGPKRKAIGG